MRRVIVHIGFPKTGTTSLQRAVLPAFADERTGYLGIAQRGAVRTDLAYLRWRRSMVGLRPRWHRPGVTFSSLVSARHMVGHPRDTLIISEEQLLVDPMLDALTERRRGMDSIAAMFTRLRAFIPTDLEVRVLMTIRRQEELVPAFVAQMAHRVSRARHRTLDHALGLLTRPDSDLLRTFSYDEVAGLAKRTLGATVVTLLPLEVLADEPARYLGQLRALLDTGESDDRDVPALYSRRLDGDTWSTSYGPLSSLVHRAYAALPLPLPPEWAKRRSSFSDTPTPRRSSPVVERSDADVEVMRRIFAASNARLMELTDFDLRALGYAVD